MENDQIDQIINKYQGEARALILILMEIQHVNHWLPLEALTRVSEKLQVPFSKVRQIASFYKTFSLTPAGRHELHVCTGTSCHLRGAGQVLNTIEELTGMKPGETAANAKFSLETVNCLGSCALGPIVEVDGEQHGKMVPSKTADLLKNVD